MSSDVTHRHEGNEQLAPEPVPMTPAIEDKAFTDPVCGMKVGADPEKTVDHEGVAYHFCSAGCLTKFKADPQKYLKPEAAAAEIATPEGTIFTCPMHPEIRQPGPGNYPNCGMALEPEMPSLDDTENPELADFKRRFWWTLPLSVTVFGLAMFRHSLFNGGIPYQTWVEFALSTPVVLWAGWPFFVRWAQSLMHRSPNMWTLIGTGVGGAYAYSVVAALVSKYE